jgi:predicted AAA+ superfamily ATPase
MSFFLFGPRGTGKTTWVKMNFPKSVYLDLLEAELFNALLANPQRLQNYIPREFQDWIVLDEIQRIPELLNEVHRLIENQKYKFVLAGSSARKLRRKGQNLLAGRARTHAFFPLTVPELGTAFDLNHSLQFGHLPSAYLEGDPQKYLASYVKTYLEEEIRQEGLTRSLGIFARFLEAASFSQGSILNVASVARECSVERKVVENYFSILEDLQIAYRIPAFTKRAKRRMQLHPKFYFFDVGIFRTIRPKGPLDTPEEIEGTAFETLFLQEVIALNTTLDLGYTVYYWKTTSNAEVDFVLYGDKGILAFEIKRTARLTQAMFNGLKLFLKDYPMAKAFLVYGGTRRMFEGPIEIVPMEDLLKNLFELLAGTRS